jgi:hypothetical protein
VKIRGQNKFFRICYQTIVQVVKSIALPASVYFVLCSQFNFHLYWSCFEMRGVEYGERMLRSGCSRAKFIALPATVYGQMFVMSLKSFLSFMSLTK